MRTDNDWAIVLAAGEGSRLACLTRDEHGRVVPKQFCSLRGERSLLQDALARSRSIVPAERTLVVVAAQHREFWQSDLADFPAANVIVQPRNRGTAIGILLPLAIVLERDPFARVVVLPSDHHVEREAVLAKSVELALAAIAEDSRRLVLLGISPTHAETDYGWIVPAEGDAPLCRVRAFVEKPGPDAAGELFETGALWNSFVFAAEAARLMGELAERLPLPVHEIRFALRRAAGQRRRALERAYERCAPRDFSREVLESSLASLFTHRVPECGWTDLGTPQRLARCVRDLPPVRAENGERRLVLQRKLVGVVA
jgi:mannose-1-phosphate guanylyltransferase